jgi:hypothetical protein
MGRSENGADFPLLARRLAPSGWRHHAGSDNTRQQKRQHWTTEATTLDNRATILDNKSDNTRQQNQQQPTIANNRTARRPGYLNFEIATAG